MPFTQMAGDVDIHQQQERLIQNGASFATTQELFDAAAVAIKAFLNSTLLVELEENTAGVSAAERLGSAAISGVTGTTVRAQIADLKSQMTALILGQIAAGTLTETEMADDMKKDIAGGIVSRDTYLSDSSFSTRRDINMHNTYVMGGLI